MFYQGENDNGPAAGPFMTMRRLRVALGATATREAETGETEAQQRERGGFGDGIVRYPRDGEVYIIDADTSSIRPPLDFYAAER